ncbi:site-2 protease family protein [Candidatus Avelusimicrobium luingense]|uniref:site-2 protease family protein n=1 Tax=Candidatus Avelusimicrobium luingense TaxID=3416211 RepID=UPI003D12F103
MEFILFIPVLFFSIIVHEVAHGYVAYSLGDDTAYLSGRLTFNPLAHIDKYGTILVPLFCYFTGLPLFGWAKPVPVNVLRLPSPRRDMGKVAIAGPAVNLVLAVVFAMVLKIVLLAQGSLSASTVKNAFSLLQYGILINVMLAVFNLMPITPLDGGRIVTALLPVKAAIAYDNFFSRFGMWLVLILILTGAVKYLIWPPAAFVLNVILRIINF